MLQSQCGEDVLADANLVLDFEGRANGELAFTSSRLAENSVATRYFEKQLVLFALLTKVPLAGDDGLSVAENCGDRVASWALNIHEVRVWGLHQSL